MTHARMLSLAGLSALAMLASAAEAKAGIFATPTKFSFIAPSSGECAFNALAASDGGETRAGAGPGRRFRLHGRKFVLGGLKVRFAI